MCATNGQRPNRPSMGAFFTNWRESTLPVHKKLALTLRNQWTRLRKRQSCCGHLGEPGC
jgi:hypothetical protein